MVEVPQPVALPEEPKKRIITDARKAYLKEFQKNWMHERRNVWIMENGPCVRCGVHEDLVVDHIKRRKAKMRTSAIWSRRDEIREKELKNCQVLCKPCFRKKEKNHFRAFRRHGTNTNYEAGCRCKRCRRAKADETNNWRWKTGRRKRRE